MNKNSAMALAAGSKMKTENNNEPGMFGTNGGAAYRKQITEEGQWTWWQMATRRFWWQWRDCRGGRVRRRRISGGGRGAE